MRKSIATFLRSTTMTSNSTRAVLLPTTSHVPPDRSTLTSLREASAILHADGLVAFPTETVYGLGASALSDTAAQGIFKAKGRPSDNPLIVHVASEEMMHDLVPGGASGVPEIYKPLLNKFWPGPLSLIFPLEREGLAPPKKQVAKTVTAGQPSVAIRMPDHHLALALIKESNLPLAAPSANLSSRPSPTTAAHVLDDLGTGTDLGAVLDGGACEVGVESTVVDFVEGEDGGLGEVRVLRVGGVSAEDIDECLREAGVLKEAKDEKQRNGVKVYLKDFKSKELESAPTTPGMKYKHYAPSRSRVVLVRPRASTSKSPSPSSSTEPREEVDAKDLSLSDLIHLSALTSSSDSPRIGLMLTNETLHASAPSSSIPLDNAWNDLCTQLTFKPIPDFATSSPTILSYPLGSKDTPEVAAQRLFAGLRFFDSLDEAEVGEEKGVDVIMVECVDESGVGSAVMERARKAAGGAEELEFTVSSTRV
ncbi:hypothetical protein MNV49_005034 [Pseudohyphozyma bogoriensis]|nr:hypothetical protein MNV49_005034 [Pseudohyphozyma bogoriensis]